MQREVCGAETGATSYMTAAQVDALAQRLRIEPGDRLLDIGSGRGWPGLHFAQSTGARVVLTDLPVEALREAGAESQRARVASRCAGVRASGTALPFRRGSFDAVVHTDVLC